MPSASPSSAVALPHELAANGVHLGRRHPVRQRLLVDANQLGRQHQRREADDRHVRGDAVVVGRIPLRDGQRLAAALRRADVVVEPRPLTVRALDDDHRRVVRLLHLRVAEVLDRLVVQRPVVCRVGSGARGGRRRAAPAPERRSDGRSRCRRSRSRDRAATGPARPVHRRSDWGRCRSCRRRPAAPRGATTTPAARR